jgi:Amidase
MIGAGLNTRVGPPCRTVKDVARVLEVIAGYDPQDELTAFSVGRLPAEPYRSFANERTLNGMRIGVIREHMDRKAFNEADSEAIDLTERAVGDLRRLGVTILDPGPGGALLQSCLDKYVPLYRNRAFIEQYPNLFPIDANGKPASDRISQLVDMFFDPSLVPSGLTIRTIAGASNPALTKYMLTHYLRERGDANVKSLRDLIDKSKFYRDIRPEAGFVDRKAALEEIEASWTLDLANLIQDHLPISKLFSSAWRKRTSTLWSLRRAISRPTSWVRPSSRRWQAGPIQSGVCWGNTGFQPCPFRQVSQTTCLIESAMPQLPAGPIWSGPFRQNCRSGSCFSEGPFSNRHSFA